MDDLRSFMKSLKPGWKWLDRNLSYSESWRMEDMEADLTPTKKTADRVLESMNSLMSFLRFTQEIGEDFPDQKLRFGLSWKALHQTYGNKHGSAGQENPDWGGKNVHTCCRRLRNTSTKCYHSQRLETLKFIRRTLEKGIRSYNTKLKRSELLCDTSLSVWTGDGGGMRESRPK